MMNSQILTAIKQGFKPDNILDYLIKKFPKHSEKIKAAIASGFTADQIVNFLGGNKKDVSEKRPINTEHAQTVNTDQQRRQENQSTVLKGAASVAAPFVAKAAMPLANAALARAIPNNLLPVAEGVINQLPPPQTPQITPSSTPPVPPQPPIAAGTQNITQTQQPPQPQANTIKAADVLSKVQSISKIDEMAKTGNDAPLIAAFFQRFHPKIVQDVEKQSGKDFENVVSEYLSEKPKEPEMDLGKQPETEEITPEKQPKIEKNSTVATPNGVGEVLEIRNGQAIVEVDGKKHKVSEDELIDSPLPEKDLADLYEDLVSGIEKKTGKQVSRNVEWAGYDPKTNELAYKPHGSDKLYTYDNLSPERIAILTNLLTQRKSTGENFIGAWEEGTTSPIGAAMYQLIQELQKERGGKGNEYNNRYDTLYDALEPAKTAAKKRHAERKKKAKKPGSN